jgi:hypothetical protein
VKTVVCLICTSLLALPALPHARQAVQDLQADLRNNLACTAATYAALDADATEADYDRALEHCSAE